MCFNLGAVLQGQRPVSRRPGLASVRFDASKAGPLMPRISGQCSKAFDERDLQD